MLFVHCTHFLVVPSSGRAVLQFFTLVMQAKDQTDLHKEFFILF